MSESVLVTGAAGFIGFHLTRKLLAAGWSVHGVDSLNDYYDPKLKKARLAELNAYKGFHFEHSNIADRAVTTALFKEKKFGHVVHLAAQAGVAHSIVDPDSYIDANLVGFANILEGCRQTRCKHLLYASSSSVYGGNRKMPLQESDRVDEPQSLYGATKRANELLAYVYAHQFGLPATGLRFFTVYGPWGRPDMAVWLFTEAILNERPVRLFNSGHLRRDFTYIDDIVEAVARLVTVYPGSDQHPPHSIYNVGNGSPVEVVDLVAALQKIIGRSAERELLPMRPVDVLETFADTSELNRVIGFAPHTPIDQGLRSFVDWYRHYRSPGGVI